MAGIGRPKKLTKDEAIKLGQELIEWMEADEKNVFVAKFISGRGISRQVLKNTQEYYEEFKELYEIAKFMQEARLLDLGGRQKLNAAIAIFSLKNNHGYADKVEQKQEIQTVSYKTEDLSKKSEQELTDMLLNLTQKQSRN